MGSPRPWASSAWLSASAPASVSASGGNTFTSALLASSSTAARLSSDRPATAPSASDSRATESSTCVNSAASRSSAAYASAWRALKSATAACT
ncbi:MAG TPA: hypothetical protein VF815_46805 [Myxococcaceae bacterium]